MTAAENATEAEARGAQVQGWTAEPWALTTDGDLVGAVGPERLSGTRNAIALERGLKQISHANKGRIVACVNALAGIAEPAAALREVRASGERVLEHFASSVAAAGYGKLVLADFAAALAAITPAPALAPEGEKA